MGLSSLAAALYAHTVICTGRHGWGYVTCFSCSSADTGDKLLGLCNKNVQCNVDSLTTDVIPGEVGVAQ